jgi:hypothetical protein
MSEEKAVRFTVSMPEPLRTRFKAKCVIQGVTMNDTIVKLVEEWAAEESRPSLSKKKSKA